MIQHYTQQSAGIKKVIIQINRKPVTDKVFFGNRKAAPQTADAVHVVRTMENQVGNAVRIRFKYGDIHGAAGTRFFIVYRRFALRKNEFSVAVQIAGGSDPVEHVDGITEIRFKVFEPDVIGCGPLAPFRFALADNVVPYGRYFNKGVRLRLCRRRRCGIIGIKKCRIDKFVPIKFPQTG